MAHPVEEDKRAQDHFGGAAPTARIEGVSALPCNTRAGTVRFRNVRPVSRSCAAMI
jgi:hypothetical protein